METEKWLTLSEVIHEANLKTSEARKIVSRFDRFLAARNFGDIIKYPPTAVDALSLISNLYRQGWNTGAIMEILTPIDHQGVRPLHEQLWREVCILLEAHDQAYQSMRSTLELLEDLVADVNILMARLTAAEEEIKNLRKEN